MARNTHIPIICIIGYHNSGKTTLGARVIEFLKKNGLQVGVIKSTKDTGIVFDQPGTDTHTYSAAGADQVALVAPDKMVIQAQKPDMTLPTLAQTFFPEMDIVVAEGFKHTPGVPKIEVNRTGEDYLYEKLDNIVALVSDREKTDIKQFSADQAEDIAQFIINTIL